MDAVEISIGLIEQGNNYILQLREGDGLNGGIGLIGCFGGKRKPGERPAQTLVREVAEETSLTPSVEELEELGFVNVFSDMNDKSIRVLADAFRLVVEEDVVVEAKEGKLSIVAKEDVKDSISNMTPATRALFHQLLGVEY